VTSLSFVSYAVNGAGVGHLSRQIAIQKWLRRLCAVMSVKSQHWFLTTSEADTALFREGFAGFKMPSKTVIDEAGVDKLAYLALAKQWVWHSLSLLRPDVFVVDTFPNGSFHELVTCLDLARHPALVYRPVKEELATREDFRATARLYERVVVPSDADIDVLGLPTSKLARTGPIMRLEKFEMRTRDESRARFGVSEGERVVVVTGGGGGDPGVAQLFRTALAARAQVEAVTSTRVHLVLAAGPLYRGAVVTARSTTWWQTPDLAEHLAGVDAAISAAGFNSVHELMFAGVPTIFAPQEKIADDQAARANAAADAGAALVIASGDDAGAVVGALSAALTRALDDSERETIAHHARALVPDNCARDAAAALLSLALPELEVKRARDALVDASLARAASLGAPLTEVVDVALSLWDRADESSLARALAVLERAEAANIARPVVARVASALSKKARLKDGDDGLGPAIDALLSSSALFGQWPALPLLLQALPSERVQAAPAFARELVAFLERASDAGVDVFAAARIVHECVVSLGEPTSSQPVLALASKKLRERAA
jgi:predicted glycosyltransferase